MATNETTDDVLRLTKEQARIQIAKLLGWRMSAKELMLGVNHRKGHDTALLSPSTGVHGERFIGADEDAWEVFAKFGRFPDWPAGILAAWQLIEDWPNFFQLSKFDDDHWRVDWVSRERTFYGPFSATPALAICAAWLSLKLDRRVEIVDETEASE
jgi:hypothetical protein